MEAPRLVELHDARLAELRLGPDQGLSLAMTRVKLYLPTDIAGVDEIWNADLTVRLQWPVRLAMTGQHPQDGWIVDDDLRSPLGEQLLWTAVTRGTRIGSLLLTFNNGERLQIDLTEVLSIELVKREYVEQWSET